MINKNIKQKRAAKGKFREFMILNTCIGKWWFKIDVPSFYCKALKKEELIMP